VKRIEPDYFSLYVDNDSAPFVPKPGTDSDYTGGIQFTWTGESTHYILQGSRRGLDWLSGFGHLHDRLCSDDGRCADGADQVHDFLVGLTAFTPRKGEGNDADCIGTPYEGRHGCVLGLKKPLPDDRPYASLLYFSAGRTTAGGVWAFHSEFTLGFLGLDPAKKIQTGLHLGLTHDIAPGGWGFQISNGGEVTAGYQVLVQRLVYATAPPDLDKGRWAAELTADVGANAGYYTKGEGGVRLRLGKLASPFWTTQRRPITPTVRTASLKERRANPPGCSFLCKLYAWFSDAYVWGAIGGEAWVYNALLEGQWRHSEVTFHFDDGRPVSLNRYISDFQGGLVIGSHQGLRLWPFPAWARDINVTYQYNGTSALFTGLHSRPHRWGGIYLGARFEGRPKT
jgi:Outer membrane protein LpxR